jgi:hypothetical protein
MSEEALIREVHELKKVIESFKPGGVCAGHQAMVDQFQQMIARQAELPATMKAMAEEIRLTRTQVFEKIEILFSLDKEKLEKIHKADLELNTIKNQLTNIGQISGQMAEIMGDMATVKSDIKSLKDQKPGIRLMKMETWQAKLAGGFVVLTIVIDLAFQIYGAIQK